MVFLLLLLHDVVHLLLEVLDVRHLLHLLQAQLAAELLHFLLERLDGSDQPLVELEEPLALL